MLREIGVPQRSFVILRFVNKVPSLAACARCQLKFFTPNAYQGDTVGAAEYLRGKFDLHACEEAKLPRRMWN
jgi:hypothetical protein